MRIANNQYRGENASASGASVFKCGLGVSPDRWFSGQICDHDARAFSLEKIDWNYNIEYAHDSRYVRIVKYRVFHHSYVNYFDRNMYKGEGGIYYAKCIKIDQSSIESGSTIQ